MKSKEGRNEGEKHNKGLGARLPLSFEFIHRYSPKVHMGIAQFRSWNPLHRWFINCLFIANTTRVCIPLPRWFIKYSASTTMTQNSHVITIMDDPFSSPRYDVKEELFVRCIPPPLHTLRIANMIIVSNLLVVSPLVINPPFLLVMTLWCS